MKIKISDKVVFWQEYNPVELSMLLHEQSGELKWTAYGAFYNCFT